MSATCPIDQAFDPRRRLVEKARRAPDRPLGLEMLAERCGTLRDRELVAIPVACASRRPNSARSRTDLALASVAIPPHHPPYDLRSTIR